MLNYTKFNLIAGCDEVGVGCLAGPVIAAAVILPQNYNHFLLKDSKQLTAKQRVLVDKIIRQDAIDWAIGVATPEEIDKTNILKASILAMHRAIDNLHINLTKKIDIIEVYGILNTYAIRGVINMFAKKYGLKLISEIFSLNIPERVR